MKEQKLCNDGFILMEAVVGVALFFLLMVGVLRAVSFITERVSCAAQHYKALSCIMANDSDVVKEPAHVLLPYMHSSITWHTKSIHVGKRVLLVYCAQHSEQL